MGNYRTLLRVTKKGLDWFEIIIPSWDYNKRIVLGHSILPVEIWNKLKVGTRFRCYLNLDAERIEDLDFEKFEI